MFASRTEASLAAGVAGVAGVTGHDDTKNRPFLALQRDDVDNRRRAANAVASTRNRFKMAAAATAAAAQPNARVRDT